MRLICSTDASHTSKTSSMVMVIQNQMRYDRLGIDTKKEGISITDGLPNANY